MQRSGNGSFLAIAGLAGLAGLIVACSGSRSGGTPGDTTTEEARFGPRFLRGEDRAPWTLEALASVHDLAVADVDRDGHVDVLVGQEPPNALVAWGPIAAGRLATTALALPVPVNAVATVDADGDGDLDLVTGQTPEQPLWLWTQTAPRTFVPRALPVTSGLGLVLDLAVADIDGDGVADLAGARDGADLLLLGDGRGGFADASSRLPFDVRRATAVAAGRLLGGPLPDLVFVRDARAVVLANDGTGTFDDVTAAVLGTAAGTVAFGAAIGDVDADGVADLVLRTNGALLWFAGGGSGAFAAPVAAAVPGSGAVQLRDDDGDLDLDAAVGTTAGLALLRFDAATRTFVDDSANVLPEAATFGAPTDVAAWLDLDGDARGDLLARGTNVRPAWRLAVGRFHVDPSPALPRFPRIDRGLGLVVHGDFDGDGDADLVATQLGLLGSASMLLRNDGAATFAAGPTIAEDLDPRAALDLDLDGALDLVGESGWRPGDGAGGFGARLAWPNGVAGAPTPGDFDGDGTREVLLLQTAPAVPAVVLLVPAAGGPAAEVPPGLVLGAAPRSLLAADLDGDGVDDVVAVHELGQTRLFAGVGARAFADRTDRLPRDTDATVAVAAGDWDGDGHVDLLVAREPGATPRHYGRIYRNDGRGAFVLAGDVVSTAEPQALRVLGVHVADVDEDGRAEALFQVELTPGLPGTARVEAFEAPGPAGGVRAIPAALAGTDGLATVARQYAPRFFDADGDLDLDVLGQELRLDGQRDLTFTTRPRAGAAVTLRVVDRGFVAGERAIVLLGLATAQVPFAGVGMLLVDPAAAVSVVVDVAAGRGIAEVRFDLPPAMLGDAVPIHAQALFVDGAGAVRGVTSRASAFVL